MNNVAARYQATYSTSVQEEAVVTDIMIALRPREFFEQHLQDSTFVKELPPFRCRNYRRRGRVY